MIKKLASFTLLSSCLNVWASYMPLHQAPLNRLNQFSMNTDKADLKTISQTLQNDMQITRYQQFYKGIPVIGAQITVSKRPNALAAGATGQANGHLFEGIQLDTKPALSAQEVLQLAKNSYSNTKTHDEHAELQIRANQTNELQLVYQVSFQSISPKNKPVWLFFIIDAQTGAVTKRWNNIQTYSDSGPGGNEKVHEYWYGKDGLPGLEVTQKETRCTFDDNAVRLVNLGGNWDWGDDNLIASNYSCNNNTEDYVNGAYSVGDDAYYFGHVIVNMFKKWYDVNALQDAKGNPKTLIMRVHFGQEFENAFWDGQTMTFGDGGYYYYPLVALDVAGHEVAHGFTEQHSNLEYHDESGALNESFSDMAGQAARAYLLETNPQLYNKVFLTPNEVSWGLGETVIRPTIPLKAFRFMDLPSLDSLSADCVDKTMARSNQATCRISFDDLLTLANAHSESGSDDDDEKQSFIVHTASGVFNHAFYFMSTQLGIKKAFEVMLLANTKYWNATTNFQEGACGVLDAAKDLKTPLESIQSSFAKVGIDVSHCPR